jgi:alkylation response protein AidB-like acyl-CoA dehydrogenase
VPKHRGLSLIIMPLIDTPGLTINPIHDFTASGSDFCQEFFDDIVVPATNVVGEVNEGWAAAQRILFHERNAAAGLGHGIGLTDRGDRGSAAARNLARAHALLELAARRDDPGVRRLAGRAYAALAAHDMARQRVTVGQRTGDLVGQWGSLLKLGDGILGPAMAELAMAVAGCNGVVWTDDEPGGDQGIAWLSSRGGSIGGGSNEMQRNIVTERLLGMPREHDPSRELPFNEIMRRRAGG